MAKSTVVPFELPSEFSPDPVTKVIQAGDRELPRTAVQAEVAAFIVEQAHLLNAASRQRLVRHGFLGGLPHIGEISMAMRKLGYQRRRAWPDENTAFSSRWHPSERG